MELEERKGKEGIPWAGTVWYPPWLFEAHLELHVELVLISRRRQDKTTDLLCLSFYEAAAAVEAAALSSAVVVVAVTVTLVSVVGCRSSPPR